MATLRAKAGTYYYSEVEYSYTVSESAVTFTVSSAYLTAPAAHYFASYAIFSCYKSGTTSSQDFTREISPDDAYGHGVPWTWTVPRQGGSTRVLKLFYSSYDDNGNVVRATQTVSIKIDAQTFAVTYSANGGSGAPSSQTKTYGTTLTLSTTKPTRAGYAFWHWNTSSTNGGTTYNSGASYTGNATLALYAIWNPIFSYDANGGTGAPSAQTKTYGSALTLSSTVPTRAGYTFASWNTSKNGTGTSYAAGGTVAASTNTTATLYAQWTKNPDPPTISTLTVVRSNSSGTATDDGEYCKVTAQWSIDTTNVSGNTATVTGTIRPEGGSATAITISSGASGTSGTATALVSGCDTDTQYTITITVTDTITSTSRSTIMTRAMFVLDLKAGGQAIGIGSAAPDSGWEVGWDTQFDQDVRMLEDLSVGGNVAVTGSLTAPELTVVSASSDIATASSGWTVSSQAARTYGRVVQVCIALSPTAAISAGTSRGLCSLASGYRPSVAQGFSDANGHGLVNSGGSATYRTEVDLTTSSVVYLAICFLK